jgi:phospholipase C
MSQSNPQERKLRLRKSVCASAMAMSLLMYTPVSYGGQNRDGQGQNGDGNSTASPIKHVIIIVGENRSFDHLYATYVPKNQGEQVNNLLSWGILLLSASGRYFTAVGVPTKNPRAKTFCSIKRLKQASVLAGS